MVAQPFKAGLHSLSHAMSIGRFGQSWPEVTVNLERTTAHAIRELVVRPQQSRRTTTPDPANSQKGTDARPVLVSVEFD
jgi:hypothetical protein